MNNILSIAAVLLFFWLGLTGAQLSAAYSDPDLYIAVTPPHPVSGDVPSANFSFHCDGPATIDKTDVTVSAASVDVFVKATCNGLAYVPVAGGIAIGTLPSGTYTIRLFLQGRSDPSQVDYEWPPYVVASNQFTVSSVAGAADVREFYHPGLDHYFMTADPTEAQALIGGITPGWTPTGWRFTAVAGLASVDATTGAVCRFYGSVTPGPNSHFYTAFANECAEVKAIAQNTPPNLPRWNYEGIAFVAAKPLSDGSCPGPFPLPVRRFYNKRASFADSNHRYVTHPAIASQMTAAGWINEGVVMCGKAQ